MLQRAAHPPPPAKAAARRHLAGVHLLATPPEPAIAMADNTASLKIVQARSFRLPAPLVCSGTLPRACFAPRPPAWRLQAFNELRGTHRILVEEDAACCGNCERRRWLPGTPAAACSRTCACILPRCRRACGVQQPA